MTTPNAPLSSPSQLQPQSNGASSQTQTPAPQVPQQQPAQAAPHEKTIAELRAKVESLSKKERVNGVEMMKQKEALAAERKTFGSKLSLADKAEKAFAAAGITPEDLLFFRDNPDPVLKKALGDKYYDKLVELRINGGAISAETAVALSQRAKQEAIDEFRRERAEDAANAEKAKAAQLEQSRAELHADTSAYIEKDGGAHPGFEKYAPDTVAKALAQFIEGEYNRTGKALSNKDAADEMEWRDVSRRFVSGEDLSSKTLEKFRPKLLQLTEKLKPATVPPVARSVGSSQERRTLSTDLPATATGQKRTYRTDEERRAAIMALPLSK